MSTARKTKAIGIAGAMAAGTLALSSAVAPEADAASVWRTGTYVKRSLHIMCENGHVQAYASARNNGAGGHIQFAVRNLKLEVKTVSGRYDRIAFNRDGPGWTRTVDDAVAGTPGSWGTFRASAEYIVSDRRDGGWLVHEKPTIHKTINC